MCTKEQLSFHVEKISTFTGLGLASLSDNAFSVIGYPSGNMTLINTVSDRYQLTPITRSEERRVGKECRL